MKISNQKRPQYFLETMQRLKEAFRAQNLFIPDEIIIFLHNEITRRGSSTGQVGQQAIELWKNVDLRSIYATGPQNSPLDRLVKSNTKVQTIGESFCLQIDFLRDISRPAYQQLQKVINRFGENVLVSADGERDTTAGKFDEHGKRMLLLNLTDGLRNIQAMEYQFISQLSTSTPPGTKVRLIPPVMCRKGLLLLKPGNIQIIGGQVACLNEKYAQKRVLATILNADLERLEKAAPPCPPPNIAPAHGQIGGVLPITQGNHPQIGMNITNTQDGFAFDAEGDAFLAEMPDTWGDDPDADAFLGDALDEFEQTE